MIAHLNLVRPEKFRLFLDCLKMMKNKKGFGWAIIALVIIAVGVGIYFWLKGESNPVSSLIGGGTPKPPALPA